MNLKTFLILILFCCSCNCPKETCPESTNIKNEKNTMTQVIHEGKWITNFKNEVFIRCLKKIYPLNLTALMDTIDASNSANIDRLGYNKELIEVADSLAEKFSHRPEALWTIEKSKVTLNVCLGYRNSLELDSLSLIYLKKYYQE